MPPESAVAMPESRNLHTTNEPDSSSQYAPDTVSDQTLKEALRTGDRDTVMAIVGKLS
ncbi:hypothetical protein IWW35_005096, partial [Coemansia sp. RSA 1878]